jgi:hypothetical protein
LAQRASRLAKIKFCRTVNQKPAARLLTCEWVIASFLGGNRLTYSELFGHGKYATEQLSSTDKNDMGRLA